MDENKIEELAEAFMSRFVISNGDGNDSQEKDSRLTQAARHYLQQNFQSLSERFNRKFGTSLSINEFETILRNDMLEEYFNGGYNHPDIIKLMAWVTFVGFHYFHIDEESKYPGAALSVLQKIVRQYKENGEFDNSGGFEKLHEFVNDYFSGKIQL